MDVKNALLLTATALAMAGATAPGSAQQPPAVPPALQNYKPVTFDRLKKPDDGDWLMVRRTYDGWGYSPLSEITPGNAARLQLAWVVSTGVNNGHEAAPIVNNGVMFVATPGNQVIALDAASGRILWRYRRPLPEDVILLHPTSRGVALFGDKVFFAAGDAVLVALDARTGREVWTTKVEDNRNGYYMSPRRHRRRQVIVGASGGESAFVASWRRSIRDRQAAVEGVHAGARRTAANVAEGRPVGDGRRLDSISGNYDPSRTWRLNRRRPWMATSGPATTLYTSSTIAIDRHWHDQALSISRTIRDRDEVSPPIL